MKTLFLLIGQLVSITCFCQTGTITGQVSSRIYGSYEIMQFAQVLLKNTKYYAYTDYNGRYKIDSVPLGVYEMSISYVEHETIIKRIEIVKDSVLELNFEFTCSYEKHEKDKTCPICLKTDKVLQIRPYPMVVDYGSAKLDTLFFYEGDDQLTICHPHWYCKRDSLRF